MSDNAVSILETKERSVEWHVAGSVPAVIDRAGATSRKRFLEFFTATIRSENTRMAYARAVRSFFEWCHNVDKSSDMFAFPGWEERRSTGRLLGESSRWL